MTSLALTASVRSSSHRGQAMHSSPRTSYLLLHINDGTNTSMLFESGHKPHIHDALCCVVLACLVEGFEPSMDGNVALFHPVSFCHECGTARLPCNISILAYPRPRMPIPPYQTPINSKSENFHTAVSQRVLTLGTPQIHQLALHTPDISHHLAHLACCRTVARCPGAPPQIGRRVRHEQYALRAPMRVD